MALLLFDGFDHAIGSVGRTKWDSTSDGWNYSYPNDDYVVPRTPPGWCDLWGEQLTKVLPAVGGFVVGAAILALDDWGVDWLSTTLAYFQIREGSIIHLALCGDGLGHLRVKCGATILDTGTQVLALDTWYCIEFKGTISTEPTGRFEVRINGVTDILGTGVTRNGGATGQWNRLCLNGEDHFFDDVYVCDFSGGANNFLNSPTFPVRVETLFAVPDATASGFHRDFFPSKGVDHGAMVDETSPNTSASTIDYCSSAELGAIETFRLTAPTSTSGAIAGVQTHLWIAKAVAGVSTVAPILRVTGQDREGLPVDPTTTYTYYTQMWDNPPSPSALTGLEVGLKIVT